MEKQGSLTGETARREMRRTFLMQLQGDWPGSGPGLTLSLFFPDRGKVPCIGAQVHSTNPRISAELPETGERFEGLPPPNVAAPIFALREPAVAGFHAR
jgi:hypothetical protein